MRDIRSILLVLVAIAPFIAVFSAVFQNVGISAIVKSFFSEEFEFSLKLSLMTATVATMIALPPSLLLSYFLSRRSSLSSQVTEVLLTTPYTMTPVALGSLILIFITQTTVGRELNGALSLLFSVKGIIFVQSILAFSAMLSPMRIAFETVGTELEEFSRTLGHGRLETFLRVVLPVAKKRILASALIGYMKALSDFGATVMIAGMIPGKTTTLPISIYMHMSMGRINVALAMIVLYVGVSISINVIVRVLGGGRT